VEELLEDPSTVIEPVELVGEVFGLKAVVIF